MLFCSVTAYAGMDLETDGAVSGISVALNNYYARNSEPDKALAQSVGMVANGTIVVDTSKNKAAKKLAEETTTKKTLTESPYQDIAISQISGYENVRSEPDENSTSVGKIYADSAATILNTVGGSGGTWYEIQSGNVRGYVRSSSFVTGSEAEAIAKQVGTVFGTIDHTSSLRLREKADMTSATLTLLSRGAKYQVTGEEGDYLKVQVDDDLTGYVFKDYVTTEVEFSKAVSTEEEEAKAAEDARRKAAADAAAAALKKAEEEEASSKEGSKETAGEEKKTEKETVRDKKTTEAVSETTVEKTAGNRETVESRKETAAAAQETVESRKDSTAASETTIEKKKETTETAVPETAAVKKTTEAETTVLSGPGSSKKKGSSVTSAKRSAIIAYAEQFLGNPYVFGGTSLTDGADCSGFTMRVYEHFGIDIGRSSRDQAANGTAISKSEMQPGDLLFYASGDYINHVSMYIGNGTVIHASSSTTGIIESPADYRTPCKIVSFLN